jgi:hypothetical protein
MPYQRSSAMRTQAVILKEGCKRKEVVWSGMHMKEEAELCFLLLRNTPYRERMDTGALLK